MRGASGPPVPAAMGRIRPTVSISRGRAMGASAKDADQRRHAASAVIGRGVGDPARSPTLRTLVSLLAWGWLALDQFCYRADGKAAETPEMASNTPWTPQRILALRELAERNLPLAEIARRLNRTERAIKNAARQFDIEIPSVGRSRSPWTPEDVAALQRLVSESLPLSIISKSMGRTEEAIQTKARELGLPFKQPGKKRF